MYLKGYFRTEITYKPLLDTANDMNLPNYGSEIKLKVRADGQVGQKYRGNELVNSSDYVYVTDYPMVKGSEVNGYPVKIVSPVLNLNGSIDHYEVVVGSNG